MGDLREQLQTLFGLDDFRPAQRGVIEDVLRGRDVLCVMPTGAGKSLCYQLPAAVMGGLTIVVSPLISLMEDQVQQLRDEGISAAMLASTMPPPAQREVMSQVQNGFAGLLYVAPERFFASSFQPLLRTLRPRFLAIDEAHCVSQWGHDFRPEYARLGEVREWLGNPGVIALTATATEDVRNDILHGLQLREPSVVITGFDRPNLLYECRRAQKVAEKDQMLFDLISQEKGSIVVYCSTRKNVDELSAKLRNRFGERSIFSYHAGMDAADRTASQEQFMQTSGAVAVATNAFGMGINKPDIRLVAHYNLPGTLEAYYQEAGRAGRDGQPARCVLLFSFQDRKLQEFFISKIGEDRDREGVPIDVAEGTRDPQLIDTLKQRATEKLDLMMRYASTHACRRQQILDYFGDEADVVDCHCDICGGGSGAGASTAPAAILPDETITLVRQLLSGIARLNGKFGVTTIAECLAGTQNERAQRWSLDQLSVFGLLKAHATKKIIAMLHRVIEAGLARQKNVGAQGKPLFVVEMTAAGVAVMRGEQQPPTSLIDIQPRPTSRQLGANPRALGTNPRARRGAAAAAAAADDADDQSFDPAAIARFEKLRNLRLQLAREKQLPPYCICHDSTLKSIAKVAPDTLAKLEHVKGMGPYKVKMYGEQIIAALKDDASPLEPRYVDE